MRVLVADDDFVTRRMLEMFLQKWGHEVSVCEDGSATWEALQQPDAPRLVILDWMMPELDGPEICRKLRTQDDKPYTYIIMLTSKSEQGDLIEGLEAGADDYIAKPFDPNELRMRIRAASRVVQLQEDLRGALEMAEYRASHDMLTGLLNRSTILDSLNRELSRCRRNSANLAMMMADVDHFKRINDRFGHMAGDAALKETAARICSLVRDYDSVGRYGGEEFVIMLPGTGPAEAYDVAERIRADFSEQELQTSEGVFSLTLSIGVGILDCSTEFNVDTMIRQADQALYRAKEKGRNRVEMADRDCEADLNASDVSVSLQKTSEYGEQAEGQATSPLADESAPQP